MLSITVWRYRCHTAPVLGVVLEFGIRIFPDRCNLWHRAADLEKAHDTHEGLRVDKLLAHVIEYCPQAEIL
jgi:pre-mRNA-processing factor 6